MNVLRSRASPDVAPGGGLLHPWALIAVILLVFNDHVAKQAWPGLLTGKISDVAGLAFFPLFLQAGYEVGQAMRGRYRGPSNTVLLFCIGATALVFAAIQISPEAGTVYRYGLALLQWPWRVLLGSAGATLNPVYLYPDLTDLWTLPALIIPGLIGTSRGAAPRPAPQTVSHLVIDS